MEEIETLQTELGQFLVSMMPVPWKKICFFAKCESGARTIWYAFEEKDTSAICTRDFFGGDMLSIRRINGIRLIN